MNVMKSPATRSSFSGLSIQQRLPLLICILLVSIVIAFGYTSYLGMKSSAVAVGNERLKTLNEQLSGLLQQGAVALTTKYHETTNREPIKKYLQSNGKESGAEVLKVVKELKTDTLVSAVELFNSNRINVLSSINPGVDIKINRDSLLPPAGDTVFTEIGKIYLTGHTMNFPVIIPVIDEKQIIGYLVTWRLLNTTEKSNEQLSQIIGSGSILYIGNDDGSFWTDGIVPLPAPPVDLKSLQKVITFRAPKGYTLIASARQIPDSHWVMLIALSEQTLLETANRFLSWLILIGALLIVIGIFIAWIMSRNITKPLNKLAAAASAIAAGNYSSRVEVSRRDELGKLATAFNTMAVQVREMHEELDKKVQHRTAELESANKELEAFSYSVSHDLHAPLRIIDGYATVLSKKFSNKLDNEGMNLIESIRSKTSRMGKLIDQLLNLSYLGKKELNMQLTDMNELVNAVIKDQLLLAKMNVEIEINPLEQAMCDSTLMRQVWSNLISNAIKYSSTREQPRIEISSTKKDNETIYAVKDNGVGFDMKYAGKLFDVFQRLHNTEFEGSGIGLALVQRVVSKHGGNVWAEAQVDKGAVFYFSLQQKKSK